MSNIDSENQWTVQEESVDWAAEAEEKYEGDGEPTDDVEEETKEYVQLAQLSSCSEESCDSYNEYVNSLLKSGELDNEIAVTVHKVLLSLTTQVPLGPERTRLTQPEPFVFATSHRTKSPKRTEVTKIESYSRIQSLQCNGQAS